MKESNPQVLSIVDREIHVAVILNTLSFAKEFVLMVSLNATVLHLQRLKP